MARSGNMDDIRMFEGKDLESVCNIIIGNGGMGVVSLYKWRVGYPALGIMRGQNVAVKKLENSSDIQSIKEEARILWRIQGKCDYILRFYGLMKSSSGISLVLQYMEHGNISRFFATIKGRVNPTLLWPLKRRIATQICDGMHFLHQWQPRPILHCDLKAANVLLDCKLNVKICDFGLATIKRLTTRAKSDDVSKGRFKYQPAGTLSHVAPELLSARIRQNKKSDVYSFGVLVWELLSDRNPYEDVANDFILCGAVLKERRPDLDLLPPDSPATLKQMMTDSWDQNPDLRPDFSELRRRFLADSSRHAVENTDITKSVTLAKQAWAGGADSTTLPKVVRRSTYNASAQEYFNTVSGYDMTSPERPNRHLSDVRRSQVCISKSIASSESDDASEKTETTQHFDTGDNVRLVNDAPLYLGTQHRPSNCKKWCAIVVVVAVLSAVLVGPASFCVGKFVLPNVNKDCCIKCFDQPSSGLHSNCSFRGTMEQAAAPPGSKCAFSCEEGYVINGNLTALNCQQDGMWSGPMPYCRKVRQCPALKNPANGGSMQCTNGNYENSKCSFSCPENFRLRLPGDSVSDLETSDSFDITCQHDGIMNFEWSGKEPYCEKVATCPSPTSDQTVQLDCTPPESTKSKTVGRNFANQHVQTYSNGTICHFSCPSKTSLETSETAALCQGDGTWNTTAPVQCVQGCPLFEDPPNSNHTCTLGRKYNSRCIFTCNENFVMVGTGNMVCASAGPVGQWTNKPPRCECPTCRSGEKCQNTLLFQQTWAQMNSSDKMQPTTFDGRNIMCYAKKKVYLKKNPDNPAFGCQCKDTKTNIIKQCNDDGSLSAACYKTYASLILMMAYNGTVSLPCDAEGMPEICK